MAMPEYTTAIVSSPRRPVSQFFTAPSSWLPWLEACTVYVVQVDEITNNRQEAESTLDTGLGQELPDVDGVTGTSGDVCRAGGARRLRSGPLRGVERSLASGSPQTTPVQRASCACKKLIRVCESLRSATQSGRGDVQERAAERNGDGLATLLH